MKRWFVFLALTGLAASLSAQALPDLKGRTVVAVTENAYFPLNFADPKSGKGIGWEYDAVNEIGKRLNAKIVWKITAWDTMIQAVHDGQYDIGMDGISIEKRLTDTSVNIEPTAEDLAEIALCTAETARRFDVVPRVAMLSFSSFGSTKHPLCDKVRKAVELLHQADPTLLVDGEIMADAAVSPGILEQMYPFSLLKGGANVLIFPDLNSANIACKLLSKIGGAETLGPILMGMSKPVHVVPRGAEVEEIVSAAAIAVVDAQEVEVSGSGSGVALAATETSVI